MKIKLFSFLAFAGLFSSLHAAPIAFDFKDPKGVNHVTFKLDAPLEAISGNATGLSGNVRFDPEAPATIQGKIVVATESLHVGNPMMKTHLHGDKWMDVAKYPEITFETTSIKDCTTTSNVTTANVTGKMTIKGISKELTVPVKLTYLKDKLNARFPALQGDLLVLRSDFIIKRSDFGIQPGQAEDKVSEDIALSLSVAGMAPKQ